LLCLVRHDLADRGCGRMNVCRRPPMPWVLPEHEADHSSGGEQDCSKSLPLGEPRLPLACNLRDGAFAFDGGAHFAPTTLRMTSGEVVPVPGCWPVGSYPRLYTSSTCSPSRSRKCAAVVCTTTTSSFISKDASRSAPVPSTM